MSRCIVRYIDNIGSKFINMNTLKKYLSSFAAMTTLVWSLGGALLFPGMAQAATLSPGDLIKASGPAVYYYSNDGKRYVFPNEKTYFSWYANFSSVKTITDAELAAIMIGGNVAIRPGTKLVKITTDPKVYAVSDSCGMLHWVTTEAIAKTLYGDNWAQRVVDVPDSFFGDYQVGSAISSAIHPDGQLITYSGDSNTYVVVGGQKRKLTSAGISANNLNVANAVQTAVTYSNGSDVTGYEASLGKLACEGQTPAVTGNVTVTLASDTPAGVTVARNAASVQLAKFNLAADSNAAVVSSFAVRRIGVGSANDLANVYLYDGNGNRLSSGHSINSSTNVVSFNGLNLTIPANSSISLVVVGDFDVASGSTGGQHAFQIADAASVGISGTGTVGGNFPVRGNTFTVGTITASTVTVANGSDPSDVTIGSTNAEIANFTLAAGTNDIAVSRIALTVDNGGATLSDFKLYQGTTVVGSASAMNGDLVVIQLNPTYVLAQGVTKHFSLHASINGRLGNTIKTYVENSTDVTAIDQLYNSGAAVAITGYDGSATTKESVVATIGGQLTVAQNGPATGNVTKGSQDTVLYNFALTSSDSQLEVRKLRLNVLCTGTCATYLTDVKVKNADTGAVIAGPAGSFTASSTDVLLTDSFDIAAGTTLNLQVTGDIANNSNVVGATYKITLKPFVSGDIKIVSTNENLNVDNDIVPNSAAGIPGNVMTVIGSSLTAALASSPASATVVKKQSNIPTAGFVLTAGAEKDMTVSQIIMQGAATTTETATSGFLYTYFRSVVSSCGLYDGTTLIKTANAAADGTLSYNNLNLSIPKGSDKTLVAQCTTLSTITGTPAFAVGLKTVTAQDEDSNDVTVDVTNNNADNNIDTTGKTAVVYQKLATNGTGSLTIATGSEPESTIILGGTDVKLAEFRATAIDEPIQITKIHVTSTGDASSLTNIAIRVKGDATVVGTGVLASGVSSNVTSTLTTPITVNKDQTKTIEVWGMTGTVVKPSATSGAKSGNTISLGVKPTSFEAYGLSSGEKLTLSSAAVNGNTMVLRKSKPTISVLPVSTTLSSGVQKDLIKFQVGADAAGDVAWKKITFTVSTSSTTIKSLTGFKLYRGTTDITTDSVDATSSTYDGVNHVFTLILKNGKEEVVSGSGYQYTLSATPTLASPASGDSITTKIKEESANTVYTGTYDVATYGINDNTAGVVASNFIWSDLSAPGSPVITNNDWTNGVYVKDLTTQDSLVY
jgi:hypothetical protein